MVKHVSSRVKRWGSAVAVSAGYIPIAHATDDSIRLPSFYFGAFGFKPSQGRNYCAELGGANDLIKHHHVITRSVRDCATFLDLTTPSVKYIYNELDQIPSHSLRIAADYGDFLGLNPEVGQIKALESTCQLLKSMGHDLVECQQWPIVGTTLFQHF